MFEGKATQRAAYYCLCVASLFLAFERAAEMYITVDEAITYTDHIRPRLSGIFDFSAANNHFLNTILAKILATYAPYNELAVRIPSILIGAWFFFAFLPNKFESWTTRSIYAALCLFPYYISEYWSMSRGYFMSACFAAAALTEILESLGAPQSRSNINRAQTFAGLATLSSFVMLPFALVTGIFAVIKFNVKGFVFDLKKTIREKSTWFLYVSITLSAYAIYSFKTAGEALLSSDKFSVFAPIDAVAGSLITGNQISVIVFQTLTTTAVILSIASRNRRSLIAIGIPILSLLIVWVGGAIGTGFPAARSWIPYWFIICLIIVEGFKSQRFVYNFRFSNYVSIALIAATISNLLYWYTPDYAYNWRSNYYQARALIYHSTLDKDFCLEETYKGDKVLIFYWDDPKSALLQPRTCNVGEKSPYGFTNFGMPGEVFSFPDKTWGFYKKQRQS